MFNNLAAKVDLLAKIMCFYILDYAYVLQCTGDLAQWMMLGLKC